MLARLQLELQSPELHFRHSPYLQGAMMERVDAEYGDFLHTQAMHPYSQYLRTGTEVPPVWVIQTLDREAYQQIILPLLDAEFQTVELKGAGLKVPIVGKQLETMAKKDLLQEFYEADAPVAFDTRFLSATSFKQQGIYQILPDVRLVFQSLMMKYSAASEQVDMMDEDALEELTRCVFVARHRIRSLLFPLEGTRVPGFSGEVQFRVRGSETIRRYVRLLLRFGTYSGIGIKTGMGMGAFILTEQ